MAQHTLEQREKDMQEVQEISLEELKAHPEMILDALSQKYVSVVLKREDGENIRVFKKKYHPEAITILEEAEEELKRRNAEGFTEEEAGIEFLELQDQIGKQINSLK